MANTPTPRSYNEILGSMISAFLTKFPIRNFKVGGPILSILEASAQSDFRNTAETFTLLASTSLDTAEGTALDRILSDEGTYRRGASPSSGVITVTDSSFTKLASSLYQGRPPPLLYSYTINVTANSDMIAWANDPAYATGRLYVGRDTPNYEGPLEYSSIDYHTQYYTINLVDPVTQNHNWGETVILAQGGDRLIGAGSTAQVPQGNASTAVSFNVLYDTVMADGETSVAGVQIICTQPGTIGNVAAGSITTFAGAPFTGAVCSNPLSLINGAEIETDDEVRARIRNLRQSRTRGTSLAIETYLLGATSKDENKRITSSKVVNRQGYPTTVYIDDGTGYEEVYRSQPYEILTHSAQGGEEYFQLALGRPVTKAHLTTVASEPWNIVPLSTLTVMVGGAQSTHTFLPTDFKNSNNISAYEVAQSINADPTISFSARTYNQTSKVVLFAKSDTNEELSIVSTDFDINGIEEPPGTPVDEDANEFLQFPLTEAQTCRLYKNDVLLSKDGFSASLASRTQPSWLAITSGATIEVNVDGTGMQTYTITDGDFVNSRTQYATVSQLNSLSSWATVLNYKIPGITVTVEQDHLRMTSNAGPVARGALAILGGTLVAQHMFDIGSSTARINDYTLNRNTGQLHLTVPLSYTDKLTAGTPYTQAFLETVHIPTTISAPNPNSLYWILDGSTLPVPLNFTGSRHFRISVETLTPPGGDIEYAVISCVTDNVGTLDPAATVFANVMPGDLFLAWDAEFAGKLSPYPARIAVATANQIKMPVYALSTTPVDYIAALTDNGMTVVRSNACPITTTLSGSTFYTAQSIAAETSPILGGVSEVVRNGYARVSTNTFNTNGDVTLLATTDTVNRNWWPMNSTAHSSVPHLGYAESRAAENSIPEFAALSMSESVLSHTTLKFNNSQLLDGCCLFTGIQNLPYWSFSGEASAHNNIGFVSSVSATSGTAPMVLTTRRELLQSPLYADRYYATRPFSIGPGDDLSVVLDNDIYAKRFDVNLSRKLLLTGSSYQQSGMVIKDAVTGLAFSSPAAFGPSFSFNDYALMMSPRVITDPTTTSAILWRWKMPGANNVAIVYDYPTAPSQIKAAWSIDHATSSQPLLSILLPSGTQKALNTLTTSCRIGIFSNGSIGNAPYTVYGMTGFKIASVESDGTNVTVTVEPPTGAGIAQHSLGTGNVVYINADPGIAWLPSNSYTIVDAPSFMSFRIAVNTGGVQPYTPGGISTMVFDSGPGADWSNLAVNDIVVFSNTFGAWSEQTNVAFSVKEIDPVHKLWFRAHAKTSPNVLPVWPIWSDPLTDVANVKAFTVSATITDLTDPVTGTFANLTSNLSPVTAVGIGIGGTITQASWDATGDLTTRYSFADGLNYIQTTYPAAYPNNYTVDLKHDVDANLLHYSQWTTEDAYLCPLTTENIVAFLNAPTTCGLSSNGEASASSRGSKLQISTATPGTAGSVQIRGGLANSALASIHGSASLTLSGTAGYVVVPTAQTSGFHCEWPVKVFNTIAYLKTNSISTGDLNGIYTDKKWIFRDNFAPNQVYEENGKFRFEQHGKFMALVWAADPGVALSWTDIVPGSYLLVNSTFDDTVSANNQGQYVILGIDAPNHTIWFENIVGVEEFCQASVRLVPMDGVIPGDSIVVGTTAWGVENKRTFTVATVNYNPDESGYHLTTIETPVASNFVAGPQIQVQLRSGLMHHFVKTIDSIVPLSSNTDYSVVAFKDAYSFNGISETFGSQLVALNKLDFAIATSIGNDGYQYSVGLIGEANKIMYSSERDTTTYPGVVAAGANVNISGPIVRRIQVGLNLRIRGSQDVVFEAVRGAVATFVNNSAVGESIAISDLIAAASTIGGVEAVSIASPVYNVSNDLITVQPYEKALVMQPELDITLTLAG
jgi:uncharacterized phage protein gp47/JayE